jgi:hypothetical protein
MDCTFLQSQGSTKTSLMSPGMALAIAINTLRFDPLHVDCLTKTGFEG